MSCNPAIGGIGKGHLVKEIDALGGVMARAADAAAIQARTLNASKGPAVRATRVQADRQLYKAFIRRKLENQPNLTLFQQECGDLIVENNTRARRGDGHRHRISRGCRGAHGGHLSRRAHPRGSRQLRRRSRRRSAVQQAGRAAARAAVPHRATEDGYAAAHRRPQHRLLAAGRAVLRRAAAGVQLSRPRERPSAAAALPHHRDHGAHARDHPCRHRPLADVHRQDRRRGPALLPERRGQGS